jgi:hypothetical protein
MRSGPVALAIMLMVSAVSSACAPALCVERRHDSGLLLVCPETVPDMPEALKAAASFGWGVAEDHPDALGYPWPNPATGQLEMRLVDPRGEAAVREWIAGTASRAGPKPMDVPRPQVPVTLVPSDRSFRRLTDIQHDATRTGDLPDGNAIYQTGPDTRRNATVITIDRLSGQLLRALVARYGTEAIVIRVDPARPNFGY